MSLPKTSPTIRGGKTCGTSTHHVQLDPDTCNNNDDDDDDDDEADCNRTYELYIPERLCDDDSNDDDHTISAADKFGSIPLVFAVHCYGCDASAMVKFEEIAKEFNFILVRPTGIKSSWNARYCCGFALDRKIDDVGFFTRIIDDLDESFDFVDKDMAYGVGWSNGGYMVTYAAHLFRSVAPIAGYQYSDIVQINGYAPTGLFQHHSLNDKMVSYNGCCANSTMKKCCCGISSAGGGDHRCTSVDQAFDLWASKVNECSGDTTTTYTDKKRGIECRSGDGCKSNTTLCVYENAGHFNAGTFSNRFPMFEEVGDFFARDACSLNEGQWESEDRKCLCNDDQKSPFLLYCSGLTTTIRSPHQEASQTPGSAEFSTSSSKFVPAAGAIILTLIAFLFLVRKCLKGRLLAYGRKEKIDGWERVPSEEPNTIELQ